MVASILGRLAGKGAAKVAKKATKRVPKTKTRRYVVDNPTESDVGSATWNYSIPTGGSVADQKGLPSVLERKIQKEKTTRDYPDVNLSERVGFKNTIQFLEDHGFKMRTGDNKGNTYEILGDSVKVYTPLGGDLSGGTAPKYSQKTFKNPTLKALRNWMGY
tara:strand:+ start:71 stop:553 length:483 start_codon:yes stop_codon:yes gene_type:complete